MKDGRTHLAHKAEHAVDLEQGAVMAVTLQAADKGDTTTVDETLCEAGIAVADLVEREADCIPTRSTEGQRREESKKWLRTRATIAAQLLERIKELEVRSYIPEKKQKGRQRTGKASRPAAGGLSKPATGARQYGKRLLRRRGELVERSFAHCYETGAMRRCHLRGAGKHSEAAVEFMWARSI